MLVGEGVASQDLIIALKGSNHLHTLQSNAVRRRREGDNDSSAPRVMSNIVALKILFASTVPTPNAGRAAVSN
jgi:hypothetical protein